MIKETAMMPYFGTLLLATLALGGKYEDKPPVQGSPNVALINGRWFNGQSFELKTVYSVNGRFTLHKPSRVERTLDLAGTHVVPPFGEAHNHNLTGVDDWDKKAIRHYLADGVFYVKIQGNLPLTNEKKRQLGLNRHDSIDAVFAQGSLTGTGGHPIRLIEDILLPQGFYPGHTKATLVDRRYFTVDSEAELETKWPAIVKFGPDFIKTFLVFSDEFEKRKSDPDYFGKKGLDPHLLTKIVEKAHANNLRVSTHVENAADFHYAVAAGADEIAHLPFRTSALIGVEDAKLAAKRGIVVITTTSLVNRLRYSEAELAQVVQAEGANLKLLYENRVRLAIGSDDVTDSSVKEIQQLQQFGVFDNLALLKMWTETTAETIFPQRKIGALREGYEASFVALSGSPLEDLQNVRRIKFRFKQGFLLEQ